jgi:CheY-like chemotaxis protein
MAAARILIANDQEWAARAVETVVTEAGYEVHRAYTGTQAVEAALRLRPDACLLDVQMPGLSGIEVAARLREPAGLGPLVPLLLTTAGPAGRELRLAATEAGAWDFLTQPIDGQLLVAKLGLFLGVRDAARPGGVGGAAGAEAEDYSILAERIERMVAAARHEGQPSAALVISPRDGGPLANPATAARLEREVAVGAAAAIRRVCRSTDLLGRIGPLRFVVVVVGVPGVELGRLQERFVDSLRGAREGAPGSGPPPDWTVSVLDDPGALLEQLPR